MKKILPIILLIIGITAGGAAGLVLKPAHNSVVKDEISKQPETADSGEPGLPEEGEVPSDRTYVKVGRQTIIPVLDGTETRALMLFELAVDVPASSANIVHEMEPRLKDAFLRELFQMSYTGAFLTNFTDDRVIEELRRNLTRAARKHVGDIAREVLILDMMRQEL